MTYAVGWWGLVFAAALVKAFHTGYSSIIPVFDVTTCLVLTPEHQSLISSLSLILSYACIIRLLSAGSDGCQSKRSKREACMRK